METNERQMSALTKKSVKLAADVTTDIVTINLGDFGVEVYSEQASNPDVARISTRLTETRLHSTAFDVPHPSVRATHPRAVDGIEGRSIELWAERAVIAHERYSGEGFPVEVLWRDRRSTSPTVLPVPLAQCDLLRVRSGGLGLNELLVNASYFLFESRELDTPFEAFGDPVGMLVADSIILQPPQVRRATLCRMAGSVDIVDFDFSQVRITLPGGLKIGAHPQGQFDGQAYENDAVAISRYFGAPEGITSASNNALDIAIVGRHAVAISEGGMMPVPRTGCVLRFPASTRPEALDRLRNGEPVEYEIVGHQPTQAVQTGPRILTNGRSPRDEDFFFREGMLINGSPGDLGQPAPASWKTDWHKTRAARLGAGVRADGSIFLLAIEGQSAFLSGPVRGATLADLSEQLRLEGAVEGIHLDGGGSVQVFRPYGGSLLRPGDFCKAFDDMMADYDRPLPMGLRVELLQTRA